jgi:hypothetical protein
MIKINKIDDRTIKVVRDVGSDERESLLPAMFVASSKDGKVVITTEGKWLSNITVNPVDASEIYIDDVQQTDAQECVALLNSFIGSFKSGGGGISPEDLNNLDNKDVAIYDSGEYKYVTLKDLDKDYQGLATDTHGGIADSADGCAAVYLRSVFSAEMVFKRRQGTEVPVARVDCDSVFVGDSNVRDTARRLADG